MATQFSLDFMKLAQERHDELKAEVDELTEKAVQKNMNIFHETCENAMNDGKFDVFIRFSSPELSRDIQLAVNNETVRRIQSIVGPIIDAKNMTLGVSATLEITVDFKRSLTQ